MSDPGTMSECERAGGSSLGLVCQRVIKPWKVRELVRLTSLTPHVLLRAMRYCRPDIIPAFSLYSGVEYSDLMDSKVEHTFELVLESANFVS
ncbi:hypothetical protein J6590_033747 [Homalodisca vitripennis]|nr:hypothetical protein J6590_033747 [Homalodisca vitripennis]